MNYRKQIRLVLFSALVQGVYYLRLIALVPIFTRCLGTELYGIWSKMQSGISLLGPLIALGIMESILRFLPAADKTQRRRIVSVLISILILTGTATLLITALLDEPIRHILHPDGVHPLELPLLLAFALAIPLADISWLCTSFYLNTDRPRPYGITVCLQAALQLASAFLLWHFLGQTLWVPVLVFIIGPLGLSLLYLPRILHETGWEPDRETFRQLTAYGLPLVPASVLFWLTQCADRYMMAFLLPENAEAQVGIYTANYAVGGVVQMVFAPFLVFYLPEVFKLWERGEREQAAHLTRQSIKYALILCFPLLFAAPLLADTGMRWIAGESFRAAPLVMFFVIAGNMLFSLGTFAAIPLQGEKRTVRVFVIYFLATLTNISLNAWLIPQVGSPWGGMTGAALATTIAFGVHLSLMRFASGREMFPLGWFSCLKICIAALAATGVIRGWGATSTPELLASAFAGAVLYVALLLLLRIIPHAEIVAAWQAIRGVAGKANIEKK